MGPATKRQLAEKMVREEGLPVSRACKLTSLPRSQYYYKSLKDDTEVIDALQKLSADHTYIGTGIFKALRPGGDCPVRSTTSCCANPLYSFICAIAALPNAIIEYIVRNTPILVNRSKPVSEYLGDDYPFYYSYIDEANEKLGNEALIRVTHEYSLNFPGKDELTERHFLDTFVILP